MPEPSVVFANLPSPPGANVLRGVAGGYGRFHSHSKRIDYGHDRNTYLNPPLMEAYAAAILEERGIEVRIVDGQGENLDLKGFIARIGEPGLVLVRPSLPSYSYDAALVSSLREAIPDSIIVAWGTVPRYLSKKVLADFPVDALIPTSIESYIVPLLEEIEDETRPTLRKISPRRRVDSNTDLDSLPTPAYHLLEMDCYLLGDGSRFFSAYSSRGCPFSCEYCPYPSGFGRRWQGRNPFRVWAEIRELADLGVERIFFRDQTWNLVERRSIKLCRYLADLDIEWIAEVRPDAMTSKLSREMKKSGCLRVEMGVETGDPRIFQTVGKVASSMERVERGFRNSKKEGLLTSAQVMVGLPGESWNSVKATTTFLQRLDPDAVLVSVATPYPGTPFMARAKKEGWLVDEDPNHLDSQTPVISYPRFSRDDISLARDYIRSWGRTNHNIKKAKAKVKNGNTIRAAADLARIASGLPKTLPRILQAIKGRDEPLPFQEDP